MATVGDVRKGLGPLRGSLVQRGRFLIAQARGYGDVRAAWDASGGSSWMGADSSVELAQALCAG